ncbi:hypothetical protein SAMN04489743_1106 [Pseudarthrobacter equi]|uniref:Uncharacterized protein n=1 Tax=Pseudarthrobacter equi TaxID=728066 RepID=A0A1H1VUM8_9MICC|nr:hypothetical protein [Pseudarthrobacter equi]SDS88171.1 hypothetical protein SAMN04489743_1106 [Pseudarthrobacter equi]
MSSSNLVRRTLNTATFLTLIITVAACSQQASSTPAFDVQKAAANTSAFQKELLADGALTREEYERAVLAERDCIQRAGAKPGPLVTNGDNSLSFEVEITAPDEIQGQAISKKAEACYGEYASEVYPVWAFQNLPTEDDKRELKPDLLQCLEDAGVAVNNSETVDDVIDAVSTYSQSEASRQNAEFDECMKRYKRFFDVSPRN